MEKFLQDIAKQKNFGYLKNNTKEEKNLEKNMLKIAQNHIKKEEKKSVTESNEPEKEEKELDELDGLEKKYGEIKHF